ncbi:hypothetical protein B2G71_14250 [Novosphingobium sp. PC22D]|uniref:LysR family transcriptional regulator n=1 Tax=Novosphingobium sp. PC22D TaxID=1962403 RepID=UPI000BF0CE1F|nr:LysR family transcriptional regulator [Novosphingobium sp. PC22D]PEQ11941.1 hypothetical protein B2G71_14250 [Novosphingobium sp. PC22D]
MAKAAVASFMAAPYHGMMTDPAPRDEQDSNRLDPQMLSDLWIFRAAARSRSFTSAARKLGVTQGAVSQRVLRLEGRLGTLLFSRQNGGLVLTDAGEAMLQAMNETALTLTNVLSRFDRVQRRSLVVSCVPSLATQWLVPLLDEFYDRHPDVELFIRADIAMPSVERMEEEGIDIIVDYRLDQPGDLQQLASFQELILPVCSRDYRETMETAGEAVGGAAAITRLHDNVPWVGGPRDFEWQEWSKASPLWRDHAIAERQFNLAHLAYHAARCGQGVAIGRTVIVAGLMESGELVPASDLPPVAGAQYRIMANRPGNAQSPVRKFASWLVDKMEQSQTRAMACVSAKNGSACTIG